MTNLSVFSFNSNEVRTFSDTNGEPWFLANDICKVLGYTNPSKTIKDHCKEKGITNRYTPTSGGEQEMTYINEGNLYRLIIKSRKPEAEAFEEHVMEVILPTIRKTGSYSVPEKPTKQTVIGGLTADQCDAIKALVKARAEALPQDKRAKASITMWSAVKSKFGKSYKEVAPEEYTNVVSLIARVPLEGELILAGTPEPMRLEEPTVTPTPQPTELPELSQNAQAIERMICNLVPNQVKEIFDTLVKMNHNNMQILAMFTNQKMVNI